MKRLTNIFENTVQNTPTKARNMVRTINKYLAYFLVDLIINRGERFGILNGVKCLNLKKLKKTIINKYFYNDLIM